jgi:outer membrane protein assembly factor BamB
MRSAIWCVLWVICLAGGIGAAAETTAKNLGPDYGAADFTPSRIRPLGFRGAGNGEYPAAAPPTQWDQKKNIRWQRTVGESYSSPIATPALVFITTEPNLLIALNRSDGDVRWKIATTAVELADPKERKIVEDYEPPRGGAGLTAATALCDGQNVYVVLSNGLVRAVSMDGKPRWIVLIGSKLNTPFGRSASPVLAAGKLIVHMGELYAFDPDNGKLLWVNKEICSTYGTPVACKVGNVDIIATPDGSLVNAQDGKTLHVGHHQGDYQSPLAHGGVIYYGSDEVLAIGISANLKIEELWRGRTRGGIMGSPVLVDGRLFTATMGARLYAFDTTSKGGVEPSIDGRAPGAGAGAGAPLDTYASLIHAGKFTFLNTNGGEMIVLEATREAKFLRSNRLPKGTGSTPAFLGQDIFVRNGAVLYCISE